MYLYVLKNVMGTYRVAVAFEIVKCVSTMSGKVLETDVQIIIVNTVLVATTSVTS